MNSLAMELITASMTREDLAEFVKYANDRLDEELGSQEEAYSLITILAGFAGGAVRAWAEDTHREPAEVMQAIALAQAGEVYTDDEE